MTLSTKDFQTNVHEMKVERDMTILHALKCEKHHSRHRKKRDNKDKRWNERYNNEVW